MPFTPKQIAKGPLFITATLIALYPICIAEVATSYASQQPSQQTPRTALETLKQSRLQTSQGLLLPASELPSLSSLQSTLQDYRSQLSNLRPLIQDQTKLTPLVTLIDQLEALLTKATDLQTQYAKDLEALTQATTKYTNAQEVLRLTTAALTNATTAESAAQTSYDNALSQLEQATNDLTAKRQALTAAETASETTQQEYDAALQTFNEATSNVAAAQDAYDNNLIPDPTWQPLTHQVPHTILTPQTTYTTTGGVKAELFNRQGYNNAPPLPTPNETPISTQIVSDIDFQWGGGYILGTPYSEDIIVRFTGFFTPTTTGTYYFFTPADDGTQLTLNNQLLINDWYDKGGGGSTSQGVQLTAGTPYPFTLYFYENGGGASVSFQYYSPQSSNGWATVPSTQLGQNTTATTTYVETTYYTTEPIPNQTHPLIKNPALLIPLQEANAALTEATQLLSETATANQEASATKEEVIQDVQVAQDEKDSAAAEVLTATSNLSAASSSKLTAQTQHDAATSNEASSKESVRTAEVAVTSTKTKYTETHTKATSTSAQAQTVLSNTKPDPIPEPEPTPEELPEVISAEALQEIDLTQIDPTTITPEQVTALQEAAYETFETAEQGSEEYEQALDALFLAAEADDIVLDPTLAAIPGLAGAVEALNFLGNAGADMSPKVREESKKVVVATVVAVGAAVSSATSAASSAASTSSRKIGK